MKRQDLIVFAPTRRGPFELVIIPSCWAMLYSTDLLPVSQSLPPTRYGDGTLRHAGGRLQRALCLAKNPLDELLGVEGA